MQKREMGDSVIDICMAVKLTELERENVTIYIQFFFRLDSTTDGTLIVRSKYINLHASHVLSF